MNEIELIEDSYYQAHVEATTDNAYDLIIGSGGYVFNHNDDIYSTPVMEISSARSCYENLKNFFNRNQND